MSNTEKFTPGPWIRDGVMSEYLHDICLGYQVADMGNPVVIASVSFDDETLRYPKIDLEQANANARLIAAAPELLEAAKEALERLEDFRKRGSDSPDTMRQLEDAIKKAIYGT